MNKLFLTCFLFATTLFYAQSADDRKIINDAATAKVEFFKANAAMEELFADAKAYVIFPNVGKGALIVGAASGNGAVYMNGKNIGMANLKQLSVGAQIGGEAYSEVILFQTDAAFQKFMEDDLKFTSEISAVAVKTDATLNAAYTDGFAVFTLPKGGLMAEVSVAGQKFDYRPFE